HAAPSAHPCALRPELRPHAAAAALAALLQRRRAACPGPVDPPCARCGGHGSSGETEQRSASVARWLRAAWPSPAAPSRALRRVLRYALEAALGHRQERRSSPSHSSIRANRGKRVFSFTKFANTNSSF